MITVFLLALLVATITIQTQIVKKKQNTTQNPKKTYCTATITFADRLEQPNNRIVEVRDRFTYLGFSFL